jgi:hypothetical protein
MRLSPWLWKYGVAGAALGLTLTAVSIGQEPGPGSGTTVRRERRQDYANLLALPAQDRERIKKFIGALSEEDPETQARLLQVARRYVTWLNRLSPQDRQLVEQAPTLSERIQKIRDIRERQWIATLTITERERIDTVTQRRDLDHARQAFLWAGARAASLGLTPGMPVLPLPSLDERQRLLAHFKQREHLFELERQFALNQGTTRQEAMQQELQRIRRDLLDPNPTRRKPISSEDRQLLQSIPPDGSIGYISTLLELARKYDVPLPEPQRRPNLGQNFPRLPQAELLEFARTQLSEDMFKDFETRLKDSKQRPQAMAELARLYWQAHPTKLQEARQAEAKKRKEGKTGSE